MLAHSFRRDEILEIAVMHAPEKQLTELVDDSTLSLDGKVSLRCCYHTGEAEGETVRAEATLTD